MDVLKKLVLTVLMCMLGAAPALVMAGPWLAHGAADAVSPPAVAFPSPKAVDHPTTEPDSETATTTAPVSESATMTTDDGANSSGTDDWNRTTTDWTTPTPPDNSTSPDTSSSTPEPAADGWTYPDEETPGQPGQGINIGFG